LLGIGFVPFTDISSSGYATTSPSYFFNVKDSPFGGTLPIMINHAAAYKSGYAYYFIYFSDALCTAGFNDYLWNGNQFVLTATNPVDTYYFPVRSPTSLWYNPYLGYLLDTTNTAFSGDGPQWLYVYWFNSNFGFVGYSTLLLEIDNSWPLAVITTINYHPDNNAIETPVPACSIVQGTGDLFSFVIDASDVGQHLLSWTLTALWGNDKSATVASDTYNPNHVTATKLWLGPVNQDLPSPAWNASVQGDPTSLQCAHTFWLTVWDRSINGWNYLHNSNYQQSITLLLS